MGYPESANQMYYSTGNITGTTNNMSNEANRGLWTSSASSQAGMSGGPVIDDATGAVVGIVKGVLNSNGTNVDVPLSELVINTIRAYKEDLQ